jgi:hypothetical protein
MIETGTIPKEPGVYMIESVSTGRKYIGSGVDLNNRKRNHIYRLKKGNHHSIKLQRHFNKYGEMDLWFTILETCDSENTINREQFYINTVEPYFNSCLIAGNTRGFKHTESTSVKLSKSKSGEKHWAWGRRFSKEHRENISKSLMGRVGNIGFRHTEETKEKISELNKGRAGLLGEKNPMFGKIVSEETRLKMRIARDGKKPMLGKTHSLEAKQKMSESRKGVKMPERSVEHRENLSKANGKPVIQYNKNNEPIAEYESCRKAGEKVGLHWSVIAKACRGVLKTGGGFVWKFKNINNEN